MKYHIGEHVIVKAKMIRSKDYGRKKITWERFPYETPIHGQVVGMTHKKSGTYVPGNSCSTWDGEEYASGYLTDTTLHSFWLVRFGMFNLPVVVEDSDLEPALEYKELPTLHLIPCKWSEANRKQLRDIMRNVPRDSKGRWIKEF